MTIPYGRQDITSDDVKAVVKVLKSEYLTQGPIVPEFEQKIASYCNATYSCAVNSATSALHLAFLALDVGPEDIVWTSPISYVATANAIRMCGAMVDFVDIEPGSANMSITELERKLIEADKTGSLPKVVAPVHMMGHSCNMAGIRRLSDRFGIAVVEDAAHAVGSKYLDSPIGCCQFSDITIMSFHPVKIITSAEGGMLLTNSSKLITKMQLLRSHGVTRNTNAMERPTEGSWYYEQAELGFNYRMSELHAALGMSQLCRLDTYVEARNKLVDLYVESFSDLSLDLYSPCEESFSSYHLFVIGIHLNVISMTRREVFDRLRSADIGVNVHYFPIHLQPYYRRLGFNVGDFPNAERYYESAITLPLFPALSECEQSYVISEVREALS